MCDPVTIAVSAAAVAALGSTVSGVMQYQQGRYQGKVADENARQQNLAAKDAMSRGRQESIRLGRQQAQLRGAQTAAMAANGVDLSFGTALDVVGDTALIGAEDAATNRENFLRESRGYSINAMNYRSEAKASRMKATSALIAAGFDAGSSILGGASQVQKIQAGRAAAPSTAG